MPSPPNVAVVTGASSGIGAATARRLARDPGRELVLVARRLDLVSRVLGGGSAQTFTPAASERAD